MFGVWGNKMSSSGQTCSFLDLEACANILNLLPLCSVVAKSSKFYCYINQEGGTNTFPILRSAKSYLPFLPPILVITCRILQEQTTFGRSQSQLGPSPDIHYRLHHQISLAVFKKGLGAGTTVLPVACNLQAVCCSPLYQGTQAGQSLNFPLSLSFFSITLKTFYGSVHASHRIDHYTKEGLPISNSLRHLPPPRPSPHLLLHHMQ